MAKIYIGTSGWNYDHWKENFYPDDLKSSEWLKYYQDQFNSVEINNSFYKLPEKKTLRSWRDTVHKDFKLTPKANRYITHMKKLKEPDESLQKMLDAFSELNDFLGPILFQLPPNWNFNEERLESFLSLLPDENRYAFEFRDKSWINDQSIELLDKHNASFCIYDLTGYQTPEYLPADFVYLRLHGPDKKEKFKGKYTEGQLSEWADKIKKWSKKGMDVYVYFNNDEQAYAPQNAKQLNKILEEN